MKTYLPLLLAFLCACSTVPTGESGSKRMQIPNDTLSVSGKSVIFFCINKAEYDSIVRDMNSGIDEVLSDFNYYADAVTDSVKAAGFEPVLSSTRFIAVRLDNGSTQVFDRCADETAVIGYVLSDGKQAPHIHYEFGTDAEFLDKFRRFQNGE